MSPATPEVISDEIHEADGRVYRRVVTLQLVTSADDLPESHRASWDEIEAERGRLAGETLGEAAYAYSEGLGSPERWGR